MVKLTTEGRPIPPASARRSTNGSHPGSPPPGPGALDKPVFELVKADPPAKVHKPPRQSLVEKVRPLLEQLMAAGETEWHRIALYPRAHAAGPSKGRLAKHYREFEWQAARLVETGQSAIYVRWTGSSPTLP